MNHNTLYAALMIVYLLFAFAQPSDKQTKVLYLAAAVAYGGLALITETR